MEHKLRLNLIGYYAGRIKFYLPGNAWILTITALIWNIGGYAVAPYQPVYYAAVGASPLFIGFLGGVGSAITAVTQLIGGYAADVWGRRRVIAIFSFLAAGTAFIYIFIDQHQLLLIPVIMGSIAGVYGPAFNATLTESMDPQLRPRGVAAFTILINLPSTFIPYLGGMLMSRFGIFSGLRIAFFLSGLFGLVGVTYRALNLKETYAGDRGSIKVGAFRFLSEVLGRNVQAVRYASSGAKKLLFYSAVSSIGTGMTTSYTPLYFIKNLKLSAEVYGILTNTSGVVMIILLLPSVRLVEKIGLRKSIIYASLSIPFNQLLFVRARGTEDFVTWSIIGGAGAALLGPSITALQANLFPKEVRGRLMAMYGVLSLLLAIPSQIVGGYLYEKIDPVSPFILSVPFFILAVVMLLRIKEPIVPNV